MKNWFSKNLGDAMLADKQIDEIEALVLAVLSESSNFEMAAFIRHESEGHLHCEVKVYFSPELIAVAREVNASPCAKPSSESLGILAGSDDAWKTLFPDRTP